MSADTVHAPLKPSLATLPPELMRLIFPNPAHIKRVNTNVKECNPSGYEQGWLGIKLKYAEHLNPYLKPSGLDPNEVMGTLRALSQTCRSLRYAALPLIWAVADVSTMDQLGRLREVLRAVPYIASYIRSFRFSWDMDEYDFSKYEAYDDVGAGSLLDLAFIDRFKLWDSLRRKYGCRVEYEGGGEESFIKWFRHKGRIHHAPGYSEPIDGAADEYGFPDYDPYDPNSDACGPDGKGKDKLIKTAQQFNECITEVVSQLENLQTFSWATPIAPKPAAALAALAKLNSITALHLNVSTYRRAVHALPYWTVAQKPQSLSFEFGSCDFSALDAQEQEQDAAAYATFEIPLQLPETAEDINALHYSIASRTIITAARSGHLKRLAFGNEGQVQSPFAIHSLLPFWVSIAHWRTYMRQGAKKLVVAASTLCPLLAHASLWLDTSSREDQLLTGQDVQGLLGYFKREGMPKVADYSQESGFGDRQPVESYLPWLADDEELAQQVADAWNKVAKSGKAREINCRCDKCRGRSRS